MTLMWKIRDTMAAKAPGHLHVDHLRDLHDHLMVALYRCLRDTRSRIADLVVRSESS